MTNAHVTIIGAGAVGVATATSIVHARIAKRVSLYDVNADKARGEAMDLAHGAPLLGGAAVDGGGMDDVSSGDLCIVTAGVKQRPGENRLDLLARNTDALSAIASALERRGLPRVILVVTNPVDVMTEALRRRLQGKKAHVLGSGTLLDTMRLRHALSQRLHMSPESVHAHVVGEHGDSSVCLLDSARAGGLSLAAAFARENLVLDDREKESIERDVRGAAYAIIQRKGATCHAVGVASARIARAILTDERVVLPVSAPIEDGVCGGIPSLIGAHGATPIGFPMLSADEASRLDASLAVLRAACGALR